MHLETDMLSAPEATGQRKQPAARGIRRHLRHAYFVMIPDAESEIGER